MTEPVAWSLQSQGFLIPSKAAYFADVALIMSPCSRISVSLDRGIVITLYTLQFNRLLQTGQLHVPGAVRVKGF